MKGISERNHRFFAKARGITRRYSAASLGVIRSLMGESFVCIV
jgi:hypothetical protein